MCVDCDHGEYGRYSVVQRKEGRADAINRKKAEQVLSTAVR